MSIEDKQLDIGVLLPITGARAALARPMLNGARMAVAEINAAGGVLGVPVRLIEVNEGGDLSGGIAAFDEVDTSRVDAIVGPFSSRLALSIIPRATRSQRPTCSPGAHGWSVAEVTDGGFFFRTVPSETLEAKALADIIANTGRRSTAILTPNDRYGAAWAAAVTTELRRAGSTRVSITTYDPALTTSDEAIGRALVGGIPDSIAIIGNPETVAPILNGLRARGAGPQQVPTFVNDTLRTDTLHTLVGDGGSGTVERIEGVSPATVSGATDWLERYSARYPDSSSAYAAYAYDCVMLLALATAVAQTDSGFAIAQRVIETSRGGVQCRDITACLALVRDGLNLDYEGVSGSVDMTDTGDVDSGVFDRFRFDAAGHDITIGTTKVTGA